MTPEHGNRAPNGVMRRLRETGRFCRQPLQGAHVAIEGELRSHEYQRELSVGTQKTTLTQRVWEIRVDTVLKPDRAAKTETADENHQEVPR